MTFTIDPHNFFAVIGFVTVAVACFAAAGSALGAIIDWFMFRSPR